MNKYENFIKEKSIFILNDIFKDYLWTQFFPSKFLCNDSYDFNLINKILKTSFNDNKINNLYIHIPFCKTRCYYCHCFTHIWKIWYYDKYLDYLIKHLKIILKSHNIISLNSIYIWWWTPNIIWYKNLEKLFNFIFKNFETKDLKQFNIDLNPYVLDIDTIKVLGKYGVTRCTYAIQSFNKEVLNLNSRYNLENFDYAKDILYLKKENIKINIDLMVWIKWQNFDICKEDILKSVNLKVDNISLNYFIQSENVNYVIDDEKKQLIFDIKIFFNKIINSKFNKSLNEQEETYIRENVNLIWIWNWSISHFHWKIIWYNNFLIDEYFEKIDKNIIFSDLKYLNLDLELVKYLFFNLVFWVDKKYIDKKFGWFWKLEEKIKFLINKNILYFDWDILKSKVNNFKLYLYSTIFIYDLIDEKYKFNNEDKNKIIFNLKKFFLDNWEKLDEDY